MANVQLANYDPRDLNYLRQLYASGQITDADLNSGTLSVREGPQNALAQAMRPQLNDARGNPLSVNSDRLLSIEAGGGYQGLQSGQGVVEQTNPDGSVSRSYINSAPSQRQDLSMMADVTRPIEIAGQGKGYYSKDGRSAIINGQQVTLGYNREATQANQDRALKMREKEADIARTMGQIELDKEKLNQARQPAGMPAPPSGYQWNADGSLTSIKGGPADQANKPTTEDEKKSAGYAIRMEGALKAMETLGKENPDAVKPGVMASVAGSLPGVGGMLENWANSPARRQIEGAQLDALDAALTLATGAAYTKEQLKNLSKAYFPQIGDDPATIDDKKARLESVIQTARIRAGGAAKFIDPVVNGGKQPSSQQETQPMPTSKSALVPGVVYRTPKGVAMWDGANFVSQ